MGFDQFTIFFFITCLATGVTLLLSFHAWKFHSGRDEKTFSLLLLSVSIWMGAMVLGMLAKSQEANYIWAIIRMVAVIIVPVIWLVFALQYFGHDEMITPSFVILISILPLVSIGLLLTSHLNGLFIKGIQIVQVTPALVDEVWELGPWFWIHTVYSYILILAGDYFIIRQALNMARKFRIHALMLLLATAFPLITNFTFVLELFPSLEVNYDPLGFVLSGIVFSIGFFEYQFFDVKPIARQHLIDNMSEGMLVMDSQKRIVDLNKTALHVFGLESEDYIGWLFEELIPSEKDRTLLLMGLDLNNPQLDWEHDGAVYDLCFSPLLRHGKNIGHLLVMRDITRRKRMEENLKELAFTDSITGLLNHRNLFKKGEDELRRALRYKRPLSVLMLDIDDFKLINDTYGHQVGDQLLHDIAKIFRRAMRQYDIAARYGGEEFVFVLPETDLGNGILMAERIRKLIEEYVLFHNGDQIRITVSIGVTAWSPKAEKVSFNELIHQADRALYLSKRDGKNRVSTWCLDLQD